ncbi:DNA cytosine methyltransferase [Pseudochelatococcus sp. B33]
MTAAPLIIDSFAGGGGASTGIEMALGRSPDIAINHNPDALALHAANHPDTLHLSKNIYHVDPLDHVAGRHIGLAWFSPDCKHFSKAKGGKPVERNVRDLAHIIPFWVERIRRSGGRIDVVIMENVEEFSTWGPLIHTSRGLFPDPARKGETFTAWCRRLRRLGGRLEMRELRACDYGAPTIRKRLFVIIRFDGQKIVWPEPTHGAPDDPDVIAGRKKPWRAVAECIDWSLPCPSIFSTSGEIRLKHGVSSVRPLADNTLARVARGMKRYVLDAARPFLVSIAHGDSGGRREYPLTEPHGVVTAGGISHAVVAPHVMTMRNAGKPFNGADEPAHTITAGGGGLTLVAPVLTAAQHGGSIRSAAAPSHTITASRKDQNAVIVPTLVGCGGRAAQSRPRGGDEPFATITAKADACVAAAFIAQHNSSRDGGGHPGRAADAPLSTVTSTGSQQSVVAAFVSRQFGASVGHAADEPSGTITANGGGKSALVSAFVSRQFGTATGHPMEMPAATVMPDGGGGKSLLVAPFLQSYYGTGDGGEEDRPARTITTKDRHGHVEAAIAAPPFSDEHVVRAREVADFMRAHGFWDEREFVTLTIGGVEYVIVDIGMRMLTPRELYNAQGFPPGYIIDGGMQDGVWRAFPKSVQVSCVGNSVSPPVAAALVAVNCGHLAMLEAAE